MAKRTRLKGHKVIELFRKQPEDEKDLPDVEEHPALRPRTARKKESSTRRILLVLLILGVLALVTLFLENLENLTPENIGNWIQSKTVGLGFGDGYPAEIVGSRVALNNFGADGDVYVLSDTALTVLNDSAKEKLSLRHSYNKPTAVYRSGRYLLYNTGGTGYMMAADTGTILESAAEYDITVGALSQNGRFALAVQPSDFASRVNVYRENGTLMYHYDLADTYVSALALNADGTRGVLSAIYVKNGAVTSRLILLDFTQTKAIAEYECEGNLVFALQWGSNNRIYAIGDNMTLVGDESGNFQAYDYTGRSVTAYTVTENRAIVSLSQYAYSGTSSLAIFSDSAVPVESELRGRALVLSAYGSKVAALLSDAVVTVDLFTGASEGTCAVYNDTRSIALGNESTVYLMGIREIRKESLSPIS